MFADIIIGVTLLTVYVYGGIKLSHDGSQLGKTAHFGPVSLINPMTWSDAIGFSAYAFEGIAVILPVQDITANKN